MPWDGIALVGGLLLGLILGVVLKATLAGKMMRVSKAPPTP